MKNQSTLENLDKWIKTVRTSFAYFNLIEIVIVLLIGIASNNIYHKIYGTFWTNILSILSVLYILFKIISFYYDYSFPIVIMDELKSKEKKESLETEIRRKDATHSYISNTIVSSQKCECQIEKADEWKIESDKDIIVGLSNLLSTLNNSLNIIFNSINPKYNTFVYLDRFRAINKDGEPEYNQGTFILRDDYGIQNHFSNNIRGFFDKSDNKGLLLEIQNNIKTSYNNGKYLHKVIKMENGKELSLISINIKNSDDNNIQDGALFFLTDKITSLPNDTENILRIFSLLITNWLKRYEHEVIQRQVKFLTPGED
jgi:hypothetical protein